MNEEVKDPNEVFAEFTQTLSDMIHKTLNPPDAKKIIEFALVFYDKEEPEKTHLLTAAPVQTILQIFFKYVSRAAGNRHQRRSLISTIGKHVL